MPQRTTAVASSFDTASSMMVGLVEVFIKRASSLCSRQHGLGGNLEQERSRIAMIALDRGTGTGHSWRHREPMPWRKQFSQAAVQGGLVQSFTQILARCAVRRGAPMLVLGLLCQWGIDWAYGGLPPRKFIVILEVVTWLLLSGFVTVLVAHQKYRRLTRIHE